MTIILHAGQQRTGSFATYQITREILAMHGLGFAPPRNSGYPKKVTDWKACNSTMVLLKFHERPEDFDMGDRPRFRILFTIRDPRDVVCSLMDKYQFSAGRVLEMNDFHKVLRQEKSWRPHLVRDDLVLLYELFVADPVETAIGIGRWLGTNLSREEAEYIVDKWSVARNRQRAIEGHHRNSADYMEARHISSAGGRVGRWREVLTPEEVSWVEELTREWMERYGYE